MLKILENRSLAELTTFKIGGMARFFTDTSSTEELKEALAYAREHSLPVLILGGGSNILVSDAGFLGLVIMVNIKGRDIILDNEDSVLFRVGAGENWDGLVELAVKQGWWGIENLSHIPGNAGAFAVQNVGAYGQEASQVIHSVIAFDTISETLATIPASQCGFGYRSSIFNTEHKGRYIILYVTLRLFKTGAPNLLYKDLKERFNNSTPSLYDIRRAIIEIRDKKFPFPVEAKNGSAGSFFKNFVLSLEEYRSLESTLIKNFGFNAGDELKKKVRPAELAGLFKVPTAYLMDLCEIKGMESGGARINPHQPLVILNASGTATAKDVITLAETVKKKVFEKTGLVVSFEPELVGFNENSVI